ncbi:hypothetical protein [Sulfuracidifex tepidarius]|uniref:Uncharacterized protein n=1 Tax=Sulfuracidifex tepidarius TaxID=1294262 RepID=A0A510DYC3_9CREN|nr:hypothetical protein [Sulfuracidifex tepidarius]BBG24960.1 hypothetical protein IC006_2294 [Sulfuracidifex tepidarius]BBG27743.1 hypothetical protein IC007_2297 [Sulfuracidifex tepidarius]
MAIEAVSTTMYISHYFPSLYKNGLTSLGVVVTYVLLAFFFVNYVGVKFLGFHISLISTNKYIITIIV